MAWRYQYWCVSNGVLLVSILNQTCWQSFSFVLVNVDVTTCARVLLLKRDLAICYCDVSIRFSFNSFGWEPRTREKEERKGNLWSTTTRQNRPKHLFASASMFISYQNKRQNHSRKDEEKIQVAMFICFRMQTFSDWIVYFARQTIPSKHKRACFSFNLLRPVVGQDVVYSYPLFVQTWITYTASLEQNITWILSRKYFEKHFSFIAFK